VILVLFLISVAVTELILRNDQKAQQRSDAQARESATGTLYPVEATSGVTNGLLSLMDAVQGERSTGAPAPPNPAIEAAPENRMELVRTGREYNGHDAGGN